MNEICMNGKASSPVDQKEKIDIQEINTLFHSCLIIHFIFFKET